MLLWEMTSVDSAKLVALAEFLIGRANDTDTRKQISVDAFLKLAQGQGIALTRDQLITQSQTPPLSNVIQSIDGDTIIFKGGEAVTDTMTVDQAQQTVDQMANRVAKKAFK